MLWGHSGVRYTSPTGTGQPAIDEARRRRPLVSHHMHRSQLGQAWTAPTAVSSSPQHPAIRAERTPPPSGSGSTVGEHIRESPLGLGYSAGICCYPLD